MSHNKALQRRRQAAVPRGVATVAEGLFAARADNAELWDVEGQRYIDLAAGIAVLNTGHNNPRIQAAVQEQIACFSHTAFQVIGYERYIALAERLNALAPIPEAKTLLMTSGAEAVENAIKIARYASGRPAIIAFSGAFHGRSLFALGLTGKMQPYKAGFGPLAAHIYHLPFPIAHHGVSPEAPLQALEQLFQSTVEPQQVAAIIIEPIQGEGGFYIAPTSLLKRLREYCDAYGIALIFDEIQSGFARTGKMFACQHTGVFPDLMTVAKALAGGYPLAAVIGRQALMDSPPPGSLGGTYGGNPVACAAAMAVLDAIEADDLCRRADAIGEQIRACLQTLSQRYQPWIGDVRGRGAMMAFEWVTPEGQPAPERAVAVVKQARRGGLLLLPCGVYGNSIRLLPPLTISQALLAEALQRLEEAVTAVMDDTKGMAG